MMWLIVQHPAVRSKATGDAIKLGVYALLVVAASASLSAVVFQGGKALAEIGLNRPTNRPLEWFARWSADAAFHDFFTVVLMAVAVLMMLPLLDWLSTPCSGRGVAAGGSGAQRLRWDRRGLVWGCGGFFLCVAAGLGGGGLLLPGQSFELRETVGGGRLVAAVVAAMMAAVVFEWIFRGVVMGVLLRASSAAVALGVSAMAFAVFRQLVPAHPGEFRDLESWWLGWELLGQHAARWGDFGFLVSSVLPLVIFGCVAGYARWRTASLTLPIFLHAGWLCAGAMFEAFTETAEGLSHPMQLPTVPGYGPAFIAWASLVAAMVVVHLAVRDRTYDEID